MGRDTRRRAARALLLAAVVGMPSAHSAVAASRYDPALRFRRLQTPHFLIYFHQREEVLAGRFAAIAEDVHRTLTARLQTAPPGRTHVILVDQSDSSNGWATPLPYDVIELTVAPPAPRDVIGNTDDWLRLAFIHEYTHILQLDRSRGFASVVRAVFGRSPVAFPNLFLPTWQIEGLATYEESATTGRGRMNAADFTLFVTQAAREGRAFPLDRASSDFDDWPSGNTPYAYGGLFSQYLAQRFGDEKLAELSRRTAGWFYFLSWPAFRQVYGKSLGDLWKDFQRAHEGSSARALTARGQRVTTQGFVVAGPAFVESGSGYSILYSSRNAHDFPALNLVEPGGRSRRLAPRYYGEHVSAAGGAAVFDQIDLSRSVALRSDLYMLQLSSSRVTRLTRDGRFLDPAIAPDGSALACVQTAAGERHLVLFDLPAHAWPADIARLRSALAGRPRLERREPGVEYSSPRWSPDGRRVAVARRMREGRSEIVVLDAVTGTATTVVSSDRARNVTPAWTPDGRTILFASDRDDRPFNLYAVDVTDEAAASGPAPLLQVTDFETGASYPDVSPDGGQIAYVGYGSAGYDLFMLPFDRATWREVPAGFGGAAGNGNSGTVRPPDRVAAPSMPASQPYTPWPTLLPRYWVPAFEQSDQQLKLGAGTSGSDVLGRHNYAATVLYRVAGQQGAPGSRRYDWAVGYTYDRWLPAFFVDASDRTHFLRDVALDNGAFSTADLREQNGEIGVFLPGAHVRHQQSVTASFNLQRQTVNVGGFAIARSGRNAMRLAWFFNSAKLYPYSISREQGATLGMTGEFVRKALGADASADATTVDGRAYLRLGGRHAVLALRAAAGVARGDLRTSRFFYLGGPGPNAGPVDFGSDAFNLLRGFDQNEFGGTHVAVLNAEYRVPLLRVERGFGTWPVLLRSLHAAGFFDAGKAWTASFSDLPFARSAGAELSADFRFGYELPLTTTVGIAWPHDPRDGERPPAVYFRIGRPF
jgi:hypothetical protein